MHVVFFAPYKECIPTIERVFSERPDKGLITHETILDSYNNRLESIAADAVISRGYTAHTMTKSDIPCAELKTSGYDVIAAVDKCVKQFPCTKIGVVGAFNMVYNAESLNAIYQNIKLVSYPSVDETLLEQSVLQAVSDGSTAIVGGCSTVAIASKYKIPAVLIESGKDAINNAIDEAFHAMVVARYEIEKRNQIANIMNYSFQGIISANKNGIITLANKYCHTIITDIRKNTLRGLDITKLFPTIPFFEVIHHGRKLLSEIHKYGKKQLMINCVPVPGSSQYAGCVLTFQNITQIQEEEGKIRKRLYESGFVAKYYFRDIIHKDELMKEVIKTAESFSYSDSNLLIYGETGTGKELFAQSIHNASSRRNKPFVAINCAALSEDLLESELFGYVEGAFTGAAKGGKMGYFEIAHKGTIFLDEIGDISPKLQTRLLRVLQEREIIRLGNDAVIPIDVRVISATNKNLKEEAGKGNFRQDLIYRLDVLQVNIPPLRNRKDDIVPLIQHYIAYQQEKTGCILMGLKERSLDIVKNYSWPGNIRELCNFCERICILCQNEYAGPEEVYKALPLSNNPEVKKDETVDIPKDILGEREKETILNALLINDYNRSLTAKYLGIDKSTLWRKMKKHNIIL